MHSNRRIRAAQERAARERAERVAAAKKALSEIEQRRELQAEKRRKRNERKKEPRASKARFRQWGLYRLTVRGREKVNTVLHWFALANNILAGHRLRVATA